MIMNNKIKEFIKTVWDWDRKFITKLMKAF